MAQRTASSAKHATLGVGIDVVTLENDYPGVEVLNRGDIPIFFTVDGAGGPEDDGVPVVNGDNTNIVMPGSSFVAPSSRRGSTEVQLIAGAACAYSVQGVTE